ncbi:MAG: protein kinase, partial [Planctomycetota bacterium JB042]
MEERPAPERSPRCLGPYELRRELGRGAMGIVYEAWHERLDRIVALKVVAAGRLASEDELRRFRTEARAASRLRHPSIVPVHDVGEDGGHHYLVMARIRGPSLATRLKDGPMAPREAAVVVRRLAAALDYAHGEGVIHRDVKPANVLLDEDGTPLLTDFGLARTHDDESSLTVDGHPIGSPAYMAPEQAAGDAGRIGPRTDVHALGAVLYALVTGRPPYAAQTAVAALQIVRERPPIDPRTLDPSIPVDLETIAMKALRKEPDRRYESARALADDLDRWLAGVPIHARPVGVLERARLAARRRPRVAALIVAFCLLAIAATVTVTLLYFAKSAALQRSEFDRQLRREDRVSALFSVEADAFPGHLGALLADGDARVDALLRERCGAANDARTRFRARLALLARAPESIADEDATRFDAAPDAFERQAAVAVARRAVATVPGALAAPFLASVERRALGSDDAGPRRAVDLAVGFAFGVTDPEQAEDLDVLAAWLADVDPYELRAYGFLFEPTPTALRRALIRLVRGDDEMRRRQATSLLCRSFAADPTPALELVGHLDAESLALVADTLAALPEGGTLDARLREAVEAPAPRIPGPDPAPTPAVRERLEPFGGAAGPAAARALSVPPDLLPRLLDDVSELGYRPTRLRPRRVDGALRFAVAWTRDDRRFAWAVDLAREEVGERGRERPLLPIDVASYGTDEGLRLATLSGPRPPGVVDTILLAGVSMDEYAPRERELRLRGFVPTTFHFDGGGDGGGDDGASPRFSFVFGLHDESPVPTHVNFPLDVDPAAELVPGFSIVDAAVARPDGGPPVGSGLFAPAGPEETRLLAAPDDRAFLERVRPFLDEGYDVRSLSVEVDGRGGPVAVLVRPTSTAERIVARDRRSAEAATLLARRGDLGPALERLGDLERPGSRALLTVLLPASGLPPDGLVDALEGAPPPLARALLRTLGRISARSLAPATRARLRAAVA